jgi:hypothetical protein
MKHFLFLCYLGASTLSIGQTQEANPQEPVQVQKHSKINKINKRVKVQRPTVDQPKKKEEDVRQ